MAQVRPFRGLLYSTRARSSNLTDVICPPYDVISPGQQRDLEARSPYNAVHLELPEGEGDQQYANAASFLKQWQQEGVLVQPETTCFYLVRHGFAHDGKTLERWGLTAVVRLEEYERQVILPHEQTREQAKEDRYRLMTACATNFSPVMCLYKDPQSSVRRAMERVTHGEPTFTAEYGEGEDLAVWAAADRELDAAVQQTLAGAQLFIADGHHRYETALRYRDAQRQRLGSAWSEDDAFNYVMMALIAFDDPGLLVLPYHRVLQDMSPTTLAAVRNRLLEVFTLEAIDPQPEGPTALEAAVQARRSISLGLLGPDGEGPYMLTLKDSVREGLARLPNGASLRDSEGWVLHQGVLEPVFGSSTSHHIEYVHDPQEAWNGVVSGRSQMAFYLKPFPLDLFRSVVSVGQRLPPKSTYFHPKLPTGLVFNPLWGKV